MPNNEYNELWALVYRVQNRPYDLVNYSIFFYWGFSNPIYFHRNHIPTHLCTAVVFCSRLESESRAVDQLYVRRYAETKRRHAGSIRQRQVHSSATCDTPYEQERHSILTLFGIEKTNASPATLGHLPLLCTVTIPQRHMTFDFHETVRSHDTIL